MSFDWLMLFHALHMGKEQPTHHFRYLFSICASLVSSLFPLQESRVTSATAGSITTGTTMLIAVTACITLNGTWKIHNPWASANPPETLP